MRMRVIITPCLLGFDVRARGRGFNHHWGIFESFGAVAWRLIMTPEPFTVELR